MVPRTPRSYRPVNRRASSSFVAPRLFVSIQPRNFRRRDSFLPDSFRLASECSNHYMSLRHRALVTLANSRADLFLSKSFTRANGPKFQHLLAVILFGKSFCLARKNLFKQNGCRYG